MRIKNIISGKSELTPDDLMARISSRLLEQGYIITDTTITTVSFKDDNGQIRSKNKGFSKVDKGEFEISISADGTLLKYTYYISFLPELIITTIILIASITQSNLILFIALPFLIQLAIRIIMLREVSKDTVMEIVG